MRLKEKEKASKLVKETITMTSNENDYDLKITLKFKRVPHTDPRFICSGCYFDGNEQLSCPDAQCEGLRFTIVDMTEEENMKDV